MVDSVLTLIWNTFCLKIMHENSSQIDMSILKKYFNIPGNRLVMNVLNAVRHCVITIYCIVVTVKTLAAHISTNNISVKSTLKLF